MTQESQTGHRSVPIIVTDQAWRRTVRNVESLCDRAARVGGGAGSVVLTSDREVKRLNARHRGRNKPTNVLTFDSPSPDQNWGDIVLARGTIISEARAAGRPVAHHLAHLVIHGALHLRGFRHDAAGDAKRMEMTEARLLHRLGVPNPWRAK
jgi:probable rRNA maturation factor